MASSTFDVRLSLRDGEVVKRALLSLGDEGQRALKRIEQAGAPASTALLALNEASAAGAGVLHDFAGQAGALGGVLQVMGRGGLAAAAGLGAVALVVTRLIERSREAVQFFGDLADSAERVGTSASRMEALNRVAIENAGSVEKVSTALETLQVNAQKAVDGDEKLIDAFERNGVSMKFLQEQGGDTVVVFNELSKSHLSAADAADLMGKAGKSLLPTIEALQGNVDGLANTRLDPLAKEFDAVSDASALLDRKFNELGAGGSLEIQKQFLAIKQALFDLESWFLRVSDANSKMWSSMIRTVGGGTRGLVDEAMRLEAEQSGTGEAYGPPAPPQQAPKPLLPSGAGGTRAAPSRAAAASRGAAAAKPITWTGYVGPAPGSYRAAQEVGLDEGIALSAELQSQYKASDAAKASLDQIRMEYYRSNGEIVKVIQMRRDAELAALDKVQASEDEKDEARMQINAVASKEITAEYQKMVDQAGESSQAMGEAFGVLRETVSGVFVDLLNGGEVTAKGIATSFIKAFETMGVNKLLELVAGGGSGAAGGGTGGLLGSLFSGGASLLGAFFGGGSAGVTGGGMFAGYGSAGTVTTSGGSTLGLTGFGTFHSGGIVGHDAVPGRSLPASLITAAPRFHTGMMPDEFPAVLQRGEGVFTPAQMRSLGGGKGGSQTMNSSVSVTVNAAAGADSQKIGDDTAKAVKRAVAEQFMTMLREQQRPGGVLRPQVGAFR